MSPVQGFNINDFVANYEDLARQNNFLVMVNFPSGIGTLGTDRVKYLVQSSSLPESSIEPIEVNWQGQTFPLGGSQTFADWTVTFNLDKNSAVRKDFLEWHRLIHDPETNVHGSPLDYMVDQEVWHLSPQGNVIQKLKLVKAWITTVGEISLSHEESAIATFDVTFRYLYHTDIT